MKSFWDRKIPTLVGLLIITIGILGTTYLVKGETFFQIRATSEQEPKNIKITNISDTSFTLTYTTDALVLGTLNYGEEPSLLDSVVLDDRDQLSQSVSKYKAHSITAKNLDPDTAYYFSITSADKTYLNNTIPYRVETGSKINKTPSSQVPMSGKVVMPDGENPSEGLVIVIIDGAQTLSTYLKSDGTYTLPLNNLRNQALDDYFTIDTTAEINATIYSQNLFSSVSVSAGEINPVPLITLSNTYDFSSISPDSSPATPSTESGGFPTVGPVPKSDGNPKILSPSTPKEPLDAQPTFEGTAEPYETVKITIHSDENIQTQIRANSNGKWTYTPPSDLSPGEHTITIVAKNKNGLLKTITQKFTVFAEESDTGTTLTPTFTPSKTPTPTIIPTLAPKVSPSPTPTASSASYPSVIIATVVGLTAATSGLILFFLTRGKSSL